ncbi:MAG: efflux RND transporter periplasmic adaptor subunit [Solidesulfovibrio sp. DCME]|uniref:efflux RND transporter periplasmic adaptor subunit n=1 Tax=Solidesulfovibrio sp. DCME TaxID=3447380 RepID=UPI003D0F3258
MRKISLLSLLVAVLVAGCSGDKPRQTTRPRSVSAPVQAVERRPVVECRSFPAEVESEQSVTLASKLTGTVEAVSAREGDSLRAGQPILRIDDKDLTSQEQGLAASREQATREKQALAARATLARTTMERLGRLLGQRAISQEDFDKAKAEYEALTRQVEAAAAQEAATTAKIGELAALRTYAAITAPFDGILAKRYVDQGAFVTAGSPLALVDRSGGGFELTAQVDESLLGGLRQGQTILAAVPALAREPFAVTVSAVVGRVDPASRTFKLKCTLPATVPAALGQPRAGMFGRVFVPARTAEKLLVPEACLERRGDLPTALAVDAGGVLRLRVVKTGAVFLAAQFGGQTYLTDSQAFEGAGGERYADVLSGLSAGDRLACAPGAALRDGDSLAGEAK